MTKIKQAKRLNRKKGIRKNINVKRQHSRYVESPKRGKK
jgi:hypothetical protein|tara:strand:- start:137 stop:253 length:117 start_codon:yes stop_codon:yes gene_type:complete